MKNWNVPPKKILVGYDFSELSKKAWRLAGELARPLGASLEAVFVYEAPLYAEGLGALPMAAPLTDDLKLGLAGDIRRELGEDAKVTIVQGFARDELLELARQRGADLVVMGTHGRTGAGRVLFGSVAESLSRHSEVPVLTVHADWNKIEAILVPLNFTDYSLMAFDAAAALAQKLGARFDALFVANEPYSATLLQTTFDELARRLPAYFKERPPKLMRAGGDAAARIISAGGDYDLVVMVAHRKSMFRDVILGTTAERVLRHCDTPVLSIPYDGRPRPSQYLAVSDKARQSSSKPLGLTR